MSVSIKPKHFARLTVVSIIRYCPVVGCFRTSQLCWRQKHVRGVCSLERALEECSDLEAEAMRGYCLAIRSSLTDDGRVPLEASGLTLQERLMQISDSIARVEQKKSTASLKALAAASHQGLAAHSRAVAIDQGCLCTGLSGRSHFGQSRVADKHSGSGKVSGLDRPDARTASKPRYTQYGY